MKAVMPAFLHTNFASPVAPTLKKGLFPTSASQKRDEKIAQKGPSSCPPADHTCYSTLVEVDKIIIYLVMMHFFTHNF
jgi:hypothetical protein